jgi:hypothetical protein
MIILHCWVNTEEDPAEEHVETWKCLEEIRKYYRVEDRETLGRWGYDQAVREFWGSDDLIIVEHDVSCNIEDIEELEKCDKSPVCRFEGKWGSGLSLIRFKKQAQQNVPIEKWYHFGDGWYDLENRILYQTIYGSQIHNHLSNSVFHNSKARKLPRAKTPPNAACYCCSCAYCLNEGKFFCVHISVNDKFLQYLKFAEHLRNEHHNKLTSIEEAVSYFPCVEHAIWIKR